jgi:hypothetical protein
MPSRPPGGLATWEAGTFTGIGFETAREGVVVLQLLDPMR